MTSATPPSNNTSLTSSQAQQPLSESALRALAATAIEQIGKKQPLVQVITNSVVTNFTANALLAIGAAPAMVDIPQEAGPFATLASGLLINLGTPTPTQAQAALEAAQAAHHAQTPWVLDPVAVGILPVRTALAQQLLDFKPNVVRGNASEILAVSGQSAGGRGVDTTNTVEQAQQAAVALALRIQGIVAISGPEDFVTDGHRHIRLGNGSALLTKVTGGGCALGSVMAAYLGSSPSPSTYFEYTCAAILAYTIAAEQAAAQAQGPGSFALHFIDRLAQVSAHDIHIHAKISI
ncbi:hydroxyethylthiazole kinase [Lampropedia puyangensis]|uniref:Hydroxyethylthiazole kinase n=1 Tax=Lampropedia puyangensis TaxID=1330072 RepID=A0A4S8FB48_9BURK|nr:hydroxyethylthiazole kinase [Lampropedia puyangensis]THU04065.1 hydroxyethylthiazole kinase [Lampropedia puyangensis]